MEYNSKDIEDIIAGLLDTEDPMLSLLVKEAFANANKGRSGKGTAGKVESLPDDLQKLLIQK